MTEVRVGMGDLEVVPSVLKTWWFLPTRRLRDQNRVPGFCLAITPLDYRVNVERKVFWMYVSMAYQKD
jgi:hypothetical protein